MSSSTSAMSTRVLSEFDNFQCILVGPEDKENLKAFVGPAFALEPLNTHLGQAGQLQSTKFIEFIVDNYADNRFCVAVKERTTGEIVGTLLVVDYVDAHSKELGDFLSVECPVLGPIFYLIDTLHEKYFATRQRPTQRGQAVEVIATAVNPIYYNRGLLNVMCQHALLNINQKLGDGKLIMLEPTGAFSQAAGLKIGGTKIVEILYSDFEYNGAKPFDTVPKPHDRIALITLPSSVKPVARH